MAVKDLAETKKAWWLLEHIAIAQYEEEVSGQAFQAWNLKVKGSRADLICTDGDCNEVYQAAICVTDFPEPGIQLWLADNIISLPEEW